MADLSGSSILVVEDAVENLDILVDTLSNDFEISVAMDGESALESVAEQKPDMILLDILLPGIDGFEVCSRLKADPNTCDIPIIFISKLDETLDKVKAFQLGGVDYIPKPFQFEEVQARVRAHLQNKKSREALERLGVMRDNLVKMVVHDMRNPLTSVDLALQLMGTPPNTVVLDPALLASVRNQVTYALEMCAMLLDINRLEQDNLPVNATATSLRDTAEAVAETLQLNAQQRAVRIVVDVVDREFSTDHGLLRRIVLNLANNAVKYAPHETDVRITGAVDNGQLHLAVSDGGKGIPEKYHRRIFELFGSAEIKQEARGAGIGLAFCKMAVAALGGSISVESKVNKGTTFTIIMPEHQAKSDV